MGDSDSSFLITKIMEVLISINKNPQDSKSLIINNGQPEHATYTARIISGELILINTVTTHRRFSAPYHTVTIDGVTHSDAQDCLKSLSFVGDFKKGGSVVPTYNNAGQVKANYTGLQIFNVTANTQYVLPLHTATVTLSTSPTTQWPRGSSTTYNPAMFIPGANPPTTMRLRENNINGQTHRWRIIGFYSGKSQENNGELQVIFKNPDSGFVVTDQLTLPSDRTSGVFTMELITIADQASLGIGKGYQLIVDTSFSDNNLLVRIDSITRISVATENQ